MLKVQHGDGWWGGNACLIVLIRFPTLIRRFSLWSEIRQSWCPHLMYPLPSILYPFPTTVPTSTGPRIQATLSKCALRTRLCPIVPESATAFPRRQRFADGQDGFRRLVGSLRLCSGGNSITQPSHQHSVWSFSVSLFFIGWRWTQRQQRKVSQKEVWTFSFKDPWHRKKMNVKNLNSLLKGDSFVFSYAFPVHYF